MGINYNFASMLLSQKVNGVSFDRVLTLGRQTLHLSPCQLRHLAAKYRLDIDFESFPTYGFADDFFHQFLDTKSLSVLDYSDYQGSTIMHDMNNPISPELWGLFDVVVDGGTLEHVFNFPTAIKNCMQLLADQGNFFSYTPCNNHAGHGFYQFSPEIFFRIFSEPNGFDVCDILLELHPFPGAELSASKTLYLVSDPKIINSRVGLVSKTPAMMLVHAVKKETKDIFNSYPIQSDYAETYKAYNGHHGGAENKASVFRQFLRAIFNLLPVYLRSRITGYRQLRHYSIKNTKFYTRWKSK